MTAAWGRTARSLSSLVRSRYHSLTARDPCRRGPADRSGSLEEMAPRCAGPRRVAGGPPTGRVHTAGAPACGGRRRGEGGAEEAPDAPPRIRGARRDRLEADQLVTAACERARSDDFGED